MCGIQLRRCNPIVDAHLKPGGLITITADPTAPWASKPPLEQRAAGIHSGRLRLPPRIPATPPLTLDSRHPWYGSGGGRHLDACQQAGWKTGPKGRRVGLPGTDQIRVNYSPYRVKCNPNESFTPHLQLNMLTEGLDWLFQHEETSARLKRRTNHHD